MIVVCGPPGSGKTTYVKNNMTAGQLIVDVDHLFSAVSFLPMYARDKNILGRVLQLRDYITEHLSPDWIVSSDASAEYRKKMRAAGASIVVLETPADICLQRISDDPARAAVETNWQMLIEYWWENYEPLQGDQVVQARGNPLMRNTQKNQVERRFVAAEMRVDEGRIEGYAAVFNEWSEDLGGFREKIRPGAFAKTLQEADVRALFNHDSNYVLGRNRAGTLELAEDTRGLHFRVTPPETTWAADLLQSVRRGDINQASFGFRTIRDEWKRATETGDIARRELIEVELYDVSPVTFPAYPATSVQARSLDMLMAQIETVDDPDALHALRARLDALLAAPGQEPHPADDERNDQTLALMRWQLQLAERS